MYNKRVSNCTNFSVQIFSGSTKSFGVINSENFTPWKSSELNRKSYQEKIYIVKILQVM